MTNFATEGTFYLLVIEFFCQVLRVFPWLLFYQIHHLMILYWSFNLY